jgi:hypothetical protein
MLELRAGRYAEATTHFDDARRNDPTSERAKQSETASPTLTYWSRATAAISGAVAASAEGVSVQQRIAACRGAANELASLPTVGVDPVAVEACLVMRTWLRDLADALERANDPMMLIETVLQAVRGDPFGPVLEVNAGARKLQKDGRAAVEHMERARATMSTKHGIEFDQP